VRPIRLLFVALLTTLLGVGTGAFALRGPDPAPPVASRVDAIAVLRAWDQRRAAAWASGDPEAVSALYVAGSAAGRADRSFLAAYAARGLHVDGLAMQVLAVDVVTATVDRLVLRVTDRVATGLAVGRGSRIPLPRDEPSTWRVVMVRDGATWLVARAGQPAR
jgi:methyl coenzyme M reductase beta subunit